MKKLMFALVGAASFAVMAAPVTSTGFEGNTADASVVGVDDDGVDGNSLWVASSEGDASLVKTYGGDNLAAPAIVEPDEFRGTSGGDNYLALETNGAELQRKFNVGGSAVPADGLYVDTLVQFTPSESAPSASDLAGAKLAIWLGVENDVTNLCVAGGFYSGDDPFTADGTQVYKLSGSYAAGEWYRLTVETVSTIINGVEDQYYPGFIIRINGDVLTTDVDAFDAEAYDFLTVDSGDGAYVIGDNKALLDSRKFIPSMGVTESAPLTLATVGFKGSGAIDDLVVTADARTWAAAPSTVDFTLTLSGLSAVKYVIGDVTNDADVAASVATISVEPDTTFTLVPTLGNWEVATLSDLSAGASADGLAVTVTDDATGTLTAAQASPAVIEDMSAGEVAAAAASLGIENAEFTGSAAALSKVVGWAEAKSATPADVNNISFTNGNPDNQVSEAYLLNVANTAEDVADAKEDFTITGITYDAEHSTWVVTPADDSAYGNGHVEIRGSATLTSPTWSAENTTGPFFKAFLVK